MPVAIRRGTPDDLPVIVEFNRRLAEETENKALDPEVLRRGILATFDDPHKGPYFVAEEGGEVLGQMQITYEWSDWRNGWMWWIQGVYVRADARRRGVFRALYRHVYEAARADPEVIALRLYVERDNRRAQDTYSGLGMSQTGYVVFERCPL
ncbi:MAG TPA: GNAT family N-acetyltransferase [Gemmataceae bacterium]|nr:GNAT family N-acetyltransferase [Gemmataceae bacterium]